MADEPRVQQLLDEILDSERTRKRSAAIAPSCCRRFASAGSRCASSRRSSMRCSRRRARPGADTRLPACRRRLAADSRL